VRQIAYRTENAAGAMADGYARVSGRVGVVAAQNGPAATLLVPPLAEALKASVPVLALVQDVPRRNRERNAFQELDHAQLFAACTKWCRSLDVAARVDDYLDMALTVASSGRPGPVALLLPRDVLNEPAPPAPTRRTSTARFPLDRSRPADELVVQAAHLIATARQPILVAGGGVHLSAAAEAVAAVQEAASLPVGTTTMGKGAVDENHPLSIGVVSNYMGRSSAAHFLRDYVGQADLIVFVGSRTNENGTNAWQVFSPDARIVHLDIDPHEVGRNYEADVRLVGDAKLTLEALLTALHSVDLSLRQGRRVEVESHIAEARAAHRETVSPLTASDARPLRPERVAAELDSVLSESDAIVVADASYSTIWMGSFLRSRRAGQRFLSPRGLAGLGWGLPMAIGARAASPTTPVVALVGDGGFGHVWSELETAVREDLPVVVVLLDNGVLGFQKHAEIAQFGTATSAVTLTRVDHTAIARACGAEARRIESADELRPALVEAISGGRTWLLEVRCDPDARPPITAWD
jgi:acetolactate synthase-1/2/3 large subunit